MKVTVVDTWANSDAGFLHRSMPNLKLLAGAIAITAIVLNWNPSMETHGCFKQIF